MKIASPRTPPRRLGAPVRRARTSRHRKRRISRDEAEYRVFAVAAAAGILVLLGVVAGLVGQLP